MKTELSQQIKTATNNIYKLSLEIDDLKKHIEELTTLANERTLITKIESVKSTNCNMRDYYKLKLSDKIAAAIYGEQHTFDNDYLIELFDNSHGHWEHKGEKISGGLRYIPKNI